MKALLAILCLLSGLCLRAADPKPPAPPPVPDNEVPSLLSRTELSEWGSALRQVQLGEERVRQGNSIIASAAIKRSKGAFAETPEQVKARGQKLVNDGTEQIRRAQPSILKLRAVAAMKKADLTKPVVHEADVPAQNWAMAVSLAAVRLQKAARDGGFKHVHFLGASVFAEGKSARSGVIGDSLRASWEKADSRSLSPVPSGGYAYFAPPSGEGPSAFSENLDRATTPRTVAVLWAEVFPLAPDGSAGLLFVRLADAFTSRVVASEAFLTSVGPADAPMKEYGVRLTLADARSFIPRLAASGDWLLAYDRGSPALGAALLRHLCVRNGRIAVGSSLPAAVVVGGADAPSLDGARATWSVASAASSGLSRTFRVSGGAGADLVSVGDLEFRVTEPPAAKK
ncbi:MAG: hypothetical protein ACKO4N_03640 [Verrucomicrobiota bacterium]